MEQPLYDGSKVASSMRQARRWIAPMCYCAGIGILLYLLVAPGESGIPGWDPVNGALRATLSGDGEPAASPVPGPASSPASSSVSSAMPSFPASADTGQQPASQPPDTSAPRADLLDLNAATAAQLQHLPGIGPAKAQAIVAYRESRNGFQAVEELLQVKGIGPKIFEQVAPLVTIGEGKK